MTATKIRNETGSHRPDVDPSGGAEFWILGKCDECGWRCAVPGEGMRWPLCPTCNGDLLPDPSYADERRQDPKPLGRSRVESIVKPHRGGVVGDFGDSLGAIALILPEGEAVDAVLRGATVRLDG